MNIDTDLRFASLFIRRGWSVIPIHRPGSYPAPGKPGKLPWLAGKPYRWERHQHERAPFEVVAGWLEAGAQMAIVTGPISDLVVVDIDGPNALDRAHDLLPPCPVRVMTATGAHWYYRHPGRPVATRARVYQWGEEGIDIRGDRGGYVVAPPSLHASGHVYRALDGFLDELPPYPAELLEPARSERIRPKSPYEPLRDCRRSPAQLLADRARALARGRGYLAAAGPASKGQRNDKAFAMACWLTVDPEGPRLEQEAAFELLAVWASRCDPPLEMGEIRSVVMSSFRNARNSRG